MEGGSTVDIIGLKCRYENEAKREEESNYA